jgi:hypothetical protein
MNCVDFKEIEGRMSKLHWGVGKHPTRDTVSIILQFLKLNDKREMLCFDPIGGSSFPLTISSFRNIEIFSLEASMIWNLSDGTLTYDELKKLVS